MKPGRDKVSNHVTAGGVHFRQREPKVQRESLPAAFRTIRWVSVAGREGASRRVVGSEVRGNEGSFRLEV